MTLTQLAPPYPIFTDKNGSPLDNGYLYFGTANLNPETNPITVYYDRGFTQPAAQPLRTSNGYVMRNGSPAAIYANSEFSVTVRDKKRALVIYSPVGFGIVPGVPIAVFDNAANTAIELLANTSFTYLSGIPNTIEVAAGDILRTLKEGFAYTVAASSATDQNVTTAGGVKLYCVAGEMGFDIRAWGAVCDGVADDTAAIQGAVTAAKNNPKASSVLIQGSVKFVPSGINYSGSSNIIRLLVNGAIYPTETIVINASFSMEGTGGSSFNQQFATSGPTCRIFPAAGVTPVIKAIGQNRNTLKNVSCFGFSGVGVHLDGVAELGALAVFENINFQSQTFGAKALLIDNWFWAWFEQCVFSSGDATNPSVHITDTGGSDGYTGLIYFKNIRGSSGGWLIDGTSGDGASINIDGFTHESLPSGAIGFDIQRGKTLILNDVAFADASPTINGQFRVTSCATLWLTNFSTFAIPSGKTFYGNVSQTCDLRIEGEDWNNYINVSHDVGSDKSGQANINFRGASSVRLLSRTMAGPLAPSIGSPFVISAPASSGTATVTSGQIAPDGSTTAYRVTNPSSGSFADSGLLFNTRTLYTGDILLFGCSTKNLNRAANVGGFFGAVRLNFAQSLPVSGLTVLKSRDGGAGPNFALTGLVGPDGMLADTGWISSYGYLQITAGADAGSSQEVRLSSYIYQGEDWLFWKPWVRLLSASEGWTLSDAIKYGAGAGTVPAAPAGVTSLHPHQTFRTGQSATGSRPSASDVGQGSQFFDTTLNKPIWSNGTVWKDAAGTTV